MRHTKTALTWIVGILEELDVPFEIDGGLAAEMYGSVRELADIDINVSSRDLERVITKVQEYITFGPKWYKDIEWEVYEISLKYAGQNIDVSAVDKMRFFDRTAGVWVDFPSDLANVTRLRCYDMDLPFIRKESLIDYKRRIGRGVHMKDVQAMEAKST